MKLNDSILNKEPALSIVDEVTNNLSDENIGLNWILRYPRHIPTPQLPQPLTYQRSINFIQMREEKPVVQPY